MPRPDKFVASTDCASGKHTFVVTRWRVTPQIKEAIELTCRHCLCTADEAEKEAQRDKMNSEG